MTDADTYADTDDAPATVVVGFDGSDGAERALAAAARLLKPSTLVIATAQQHGLPGTGSRHRDEAEAINAAGVELARQHGDATGVVTSARTAAAGLLDTAGDVGAQAIVVGFRGRSTVRSMLMGSCSYALAHRASIPTLIVPDRHPSVGPDQAPGLALVAVDEHDDKPTHLARALDLVRCSEAIAMHVGEGRLTGDRTLDEHGRPLSYTEVRDRASTLNEAARLDAEEIAKRAASWLAEHTSGRIHSEGAVSVGGVWQRLVERADSDDVDLIVVGSRGLDVLDRTTLGSVSNAVVHHAHKPVLIAR